MASDKKQVELEAPSHRRPAPLLSVAPVEVNSLGLGRLRLNASFPSTPTSTLGGPAVSLGHSGHATVAFTDVGSLSLSSPLGVPSDGTHATIGEGSHPSQHHPVLRFNDDMMELHDDVTYMVGGYPAHSVERWGVVLLQIASVDGLLAYLGGLEAPPQGSGSAESAFESYIREMCHEFVDPGTDDVLVYLTTRSRIILRRAWDSVVAPYLQANASMDRRPHVSLAIPSPNLNLSGFSSELSDNVVLSLSATTATQPQASLVPDSDASPGGAQPQPGHPSTHTNQGVDSQDLDSYGGTHVDVDSATSRSQATDLRNTAVDGASYQIRMSLDSIRSGVASINKELQHIVAAGNPQEAAPRVGALKRARRRLQLTARVLAAAFGGAWSSRPPSPSPVVADGPVGGSRQVSKAAGKPDDDSESFFPNRRASDVSSLPPWVIAPYTPAPQGTQPLISTSSSSGRFRMTGIAQRAPPISASGTPTPSNDDPRPAATLPAIGIPPYATSPDSDIVRRILASASQAEILDPTLWPALFRRIVGHCDFLNDSSVPDSNAPATSTSTPLLSIACINPCHRDLNLPCTHSIAIPFNLELSSLLRQLATSQGVRISQLMAMVAGAVLDQQHTSLTSGASSLTTPTHGPTGGPSGTSNDQDHTDGAIVKGKARGPM